jgi:hypothetical protein
MLIRITKLIREEHEITFEPKGRTTYGEGLDALIADALAQGQEIGEILLTIPSDEWRQVEIDYHGDVAAAAVKKGGKL